MLLRAPLSCVGLNRPAVTLANLASLKLIRSCVEPYSRVKSHFVKQWKRLTRKADMFACLDLSCWFRRVQICS